MIHLQTLDKSIVSLFFTCIKIILMFLFVCKVNQSPIGFKNIWNVNGGTIERLYCRSVVSENSMKCTLTESSRSLQAANEAPVSRIRVCNAQAVRHSANVRLYQDVHEDETLELRPKDCILCLLEWKTPYSLYLRSSQRQQICNLILMLIIRKIFRMK